MINNSIFSEPDDKNTISLRQKRIVAILGIGLLLISAALIAQQKRPESVPNPASAVTETVSSVHTRGDIKSFVNAIQWPALDKRSEKLRAQLSPEIVAHVNASPVPVLLPPFNPEEKITMGTDPAGYFANVSNGERSFMITATRIFFHLPDLYDEMGRPKFAPPERVRDLPAWIGESEGIWRVGWEENGAAYELTFSCPSTRESTCGEVAYARALADSLIFAGGAR